MVVCHWTHLHPRRFSEQACKCLVYYTSGVMQAPFLLWNNLGGLDNPAQCIERLSKLITIQHSEVYIGYCTRMAVNGRELVVLSEAKHAALTSSYQV